MLIYFPGKIMEMHPEWQILVLQKTLARNKHDVEKPESDQEAFWLDLLNLYIAYKKDIDETLDSGEGPFLLTEWNMAYGALLTQVQAAQKTGKDSAVLRQEAEESEKVMMKGVKAGKGRKGGKEEGDEEPKGTGLGKKNTDLGHLYKNRPLMLFLTKTFVLQEEFRHTILYKPTPLSKKINGSIGGVSDWLCSGRVD